MQMWNGVKLQVEAENMQNFAREEIRCTRGPST